MPGLRLDYTASDYDESAHRGVVQLDLQAIDLPDASVDVVLTPHVLEHVPDTDRALAELFRILTPGGSVFLQVPLPQAVTGVPAEPEYHGDHTLVFFRFGWGARLPHYPAAAPRSATGQQQRVSDDLHHLPRLG